MCVCVCVCVCVRERVCVHVLGVVIEGKGRAGSSWQGESREPRAGVWAAFHAGFGKSRWKERIGGSCGTAAGKQGCIL